MYPVKRFSPNADPLLIQQYLKADGVVIIEGLAMRQVLDDVLSELPAEAKTQPETFGLASKSKTFATELMMQPVYLDLVRRILIDACIIYYEQDRTVSVAEPQLSQAWSIAAQPGSSGWGLRRQDECHHVKHPAKREADFGILYAATDITKENGAIRVAVGSNNWLDTRDPKPEEETLIELRKGDALPCTGSTFYGQAPNTTDTPSILLGAFSTPGYLRQQENQYLAVPWEVAEKYPLEVQKFLGYSISRPYGGSIEHMEPYEYLKVKRDPTKYVCGDII
ncbi:hypothetical protein SAPIO_CDS0009 [Scedosporium apiospermum]|uniref:Uncharacterized protein n=1 Tax=Pseudallescheria apiosperma TaxID=563466 RepID=A0A084GHC1_PSEDA|nr:uncharacterized protein SAPIO_CDS0009 [Scedosporium apiospermum]KEZ46733.1 hypothetical protein SAPIO_CDS0009 [Scedosporium apiospermum]